MQKENLKNSFGENNLGISIVDSNLDKQSNNIKITGFLTSSVRPKPSDKTYMVFLRPFRDCEKHSWAECETTKCQECEIPVIFRIKSEGHTYLHHELKGCVYPENHWQKPNLNKGDKVILEGRFEPSKKSPRPSFTAYSYQIINNHE